MPVSESPQSRPSLPPWDEPIAIIGASCRLPSANSPDDLWRILSAGEPIFSPAPNKRWNTNIAPAPADTTMENPADPAQLTNKKKLPRGAFLSDDQLEKFDPEFFHLTEQEVLDMDPHQRLALLVCFESLLNAGTPRPSTSTSSSTTTTTSNPYWDPSTRYVPAARAEVGVFVGVGVGVADAASVALQNPATPTSNFGYLPFSIANRVSHCLGLSGPSVNVDTACSGSLTAVHYACQSILSHESETAIAAGVNVITNPSSYAHIDLLRILSPTYHSPVLTPNVTGYTRGEGAVAFVLKRLSAAKRDGDRILGIVRGSAAGHNGRTGRQMATPSLDGQSRVLRLAHQRAGLAPHAVDYVELHATGTQAGDKRELQTIAAVYGGEEAKPRGGTGVLVGGIKSLYGHSEAASGITSMLKALLIARHGEAPPLVHFTSPRTDVPLPPDEIRICPGKGMTKLPRRDGVVRCGVNSFGAGGTNAHVIVESVPDDEGDIGYADFPYPNAKPYSMIQQRGTYYKTEQVIGWEKTE
ncbi:thiolase-like protein [Gonapodya prolifera JEL478]|uniref:Thiolase-like protein n=1 Tax=Gonapodya prolifera (strain JEL478) TaxID=1344416 RepID=A0A138ZYL0_GONPJ|nr:thiolase-like protein [Gonapodya prolifera JEL478]|eukprot:KXS09561.1 thiolase-like protein [Gonapodya prolifera JEL478]